MKHILLLATFLLVSGVVPLDAQQKLNRANQVNKQGMTSWQLQELTSNKKQVQSILQRLNKKQSTTPDVDIAKVLELNDAIKVYDPISARRFNAQLEKYQESVEEAVHIEPEVEIEQEEFEQWPIINPVKPVQLPEKFQEEKIEITQPSIVTGEVAGSEMLDFLVRLRLLDGLWDQIINPKNVPTIKKLEETSAYQRLIKKDIVVDINNWYNRVKNKSVVSPEDVFFKDLVNELLAQAVTLKDTVKDISSQDLDPYTKSMYVTIFSSIFRVLQSLDKALKNIASRYKNYAYDTSIAKQISETAKLLDAWELSSIEWEVKQRAGGLQAPYIERLPAFVPLTPEYPEKVAANQPGIQTTQTIPIYSADMPQKGEVKTTLLQDVTSYLRDFKDELEAYGLQKTGTVGDFEYMQSTRIYTRLVGSPDKIMQWAKQATIDEKKSAEFQAIKDDLQKLITMLKTTVDMFGKFVKEAPYQNNTQQYINFVSAAFALLQDLNGVLRRLAERFKLDARGIALELNKINQELESQVGKGKGSYVRPHLKQSIVNFTGK